MSQNLNLVQFFKIMVQVMHRAEIPQRTSKQCQPTVNSLVSIISDGLCTHLIAFTCLYQPWFVTALPHDIHFAMLTLIQALWAQSVDKVLWIGLWKALFCRHKLQIWYTAVCPLPYPAQPPSAPRAPNHVQHTALSHPSEADHSAL